MRIVHIDCGREMRGGQWQVLRLRAELVLGNDIVRVGRTTDARGLITRLGIVDLVVRVVGEPVAEVTHAILGCGDAGYNGCALRLTVQLRIAEEEQLVLQYRPTYG
ncbi:hypothetical protein B4Q13_22640, partial [Lacticaseibacillus rhamnosus]